MNRLIISLALGTLTLVGQTVTMSLSGTASLTSSSTYAITGTASVSGIGNATLSGGGPIDISGATGDTTGPIGGNFSMVFSDGGILYGTFAIPRGIIIPQLGGNTTAMGSINVLGGIGRFDGARGTMGNLSGTGTVSSTTSSAFSVSGTGTLGTGQKVLPQFVYGGGWYTALYFSNPTAAAVSFPLTVTGDNGSALAVPGFPTNASIPAGGAVRLEALNSGDLSQGYVTATPPAGVTGYAVFRQSAPGVADQEAVVPLSSVGASTNLLTFDDTNYVTAAAIVNPGATTVTVAVTAKNASGASLGSGSITLNARSKTAVALRSVAGLSGVAGNSGTATFTVSSGSIAVLGLRFNGSAFTSIPASDK